MPAPTNTPIQEQPGELAMPPRPSYAPIAYLAPCSMDIADRLEVKIGSMFRAINQIPEGAIFDSRSEQIISLIETHTQARRGIEAAFTIPETRSLKPDLPHCMPPNKADREGAYIVEQFLYCLKNELPIDAQLKGLVRQYGERYPQ